MRTTIAPWLAAGALGAALVAALPAAAATAPACDRACLEGFADKYMAALARHDTRGVPWAKLVKFSENNVALEIGDGAWGTVTDVLGGQAVLKVADPKTGNVAWWGAVREKDIESLYSMRLKVIDGKIAEVETMITRKAYVGANFNVDISKLKHDPQWTEVIPAAKRLSREKLITFADGYFSTLELNDGVLRTDFAADCARMENGFYTAGNPDPKSGNSHNYCGDQFKTGSFHIDDRVRDRRHFLVDEERGIVMSAAYIDHAAMQTEITLTNGTKRPSGIKAPHVWCLLEMFKVKDGKLSRIEANFIAVPYRMPSPWVLDGAPTNNRLEDYPLPRERVGRAMKTSAKRGK
ncbi:MAG: hypothetical protein ABIO39_01035 [Caulobacteraceae bacterium]